MKDSKYPSFVQRVYSVWYRHMRVYTKNLISNGFPPFLEPLIFLAGVGLGLGKFITWTESMGYLQFLASGLLITTAMYTSSFECSFGTFIRLEFQKVYDGMLAAPITLSNMFVGEILWAGTKGFFFSFAVLCMLFLFGIFPLTGALLTPLVGFVTGIIFAVVSLLVTSYVKDINHLNFYFTGFLSPMFFFSGVVFPIRSLPSFLRPLAEVFPLTHTVRLARALCEIRFEMNLLWDLAYCLVLAVVIGYLAIRRLKQRLLS